MQLSETVAPASREWMQQLTGSLLREFGERLIFTGLQGSRARGEEDSLSDIDPVVVLDCLSAEDLSHIRSVYSGMPEQGELCGFVSGRQELACWDPADRLSFYYSTLPFYGRLEDIFPVPSAEDAAQAVLSGACGVYHMTCHCLLYGCDEQTLSGLLKSARFILQAQRLCETGEYPQRLEELFHTATGQVQELLKMYIALRGFKKLSANEQNQVLEQLLNWSGALVRQYGASVES